MARRGLRRVSRKGDPAPLLRDLKAGQPWTASERPNLRLLHLLTGHDFFDDLYADQEEPKLCWEGVRSEFLAAHIRRNPGTRPWAWWQFDAPFAERGGREAVSRWLGASEYASLNGIESQSEYLRRFDLLSPSEVDVKGPSIELDPCTTYAQQVLAGNLVAGELVRFACQRHLDDLEGSNLRLNVRLVDRFRVFCGLLRHYKGQSGGLLFTLEPWQMFVMGSIFGWTRPDGRRRFLEAWVEIAKKNGKTFLLAAAGLYLLLADQENGPEIFCAAAQLSQAKRAFGDMRTLAKKSPALESRLRILATRLEVLGGRMGEALPLGRATEETAARFDGINPHAGLLDEVHAQADGGMYDVLSSAMVSRANPLLFQITTAGFNSEAWGGRQSRHFASLVDPRQPISNDRAFVFIARLDSRDEQKDPSAWIKANPNLGVSVTSDALIQEAAKATAKKGAAFGSFLTKNLNVWMSGAASTWLSMTCWSDCGSPEPIAWREDALKRLRGRRCFGGLDLSKSTDLTAMVLIFPDLTQPDVGPLEVLPWFWLPSEGIEDKVIRDRVPYGKWADEGFLSLCPGPVIDPTMIEELVLELREHFEVAEIGFDPTQALSMANRLGSAGLELVQFPQSFQMYHEPTTKLEELVLSRRLRHGSNPILTMHAARTVLARSHADYVKPDRRNAGHLGNRIDGIVALVMALGRALVGASEPEQVIESIYSSRGPVVLR